MTLELDDETREALGYGDPLWWVGEWAEFRRAKFKRDEANRDPLKKRLRERSRQGRPRTEGYKSRKRKRDAERIARKRKGRAS